MILSISIRSAMMIRALSLVSSMILIGLPGSACPSPLPATIRSEKIFDSNGAMRLAEVYSRGTSLN